MGEVKIKKHSAKSNNQKIDEKEASKFSDDLMEAYNFQPQKQSKFKKIFFSEINLVKPKAQKKAELISKKHPNVKPLEPSLKKQAKQVKKAQNANPKNLNGRPFALRVVISTAKVFLFMISLTLVLFSGAVYAYKNQYRDRALYGTRILGEEVAGKTKDQIQKILQAKIDGITLSFAIDGQNFVVKPEEAGVNFKPGNSAGAAIVKGKSGDWFDQYFAAANSILYKISPSVSASVGGSFQNNLDIDYSIDDAKLALFTQNLSDRFNVGSQNAGLVMSGTDVQVIPAVAGRRIVADSVKLQIAEGIRSGNSSEIKIDTQKVEPRIIESETRESIEAAKNILNQSVQYHYNGQNFTPDKITVATWIIFNTVGEGENQKLVPAVDAKMVYSYVYSLARKINVPAVAKKVTVTNGGQQTVDQEGKDGLAVDVDSAATTTSTLLSSGRAVNLELPTYSIKAKTTVNNIVVANWDKYIDVNISTQRMCAYLAGGVQVNCWAITTGRNGWNTPVGTFLVQRKAYVTSMPNPPSPYPLNNIHYVSYFTSQGHAIHEAWWRSSFGGQDYTWNGSHGCVNAPIGVAQFIYDWAPIGTPVITHY